MKDNFFVISQKNSNISKMVRISFKIMQCKEHLNLTPSSAVDNLLSGQSPHIENETTTPPKLASSPKTEKQLQEEKEFLAFFEKAVDYGYSKDEDFVEIKDFFNSDGKMLNTLHKFEENIVDMAKSDEDYKKVIKDKNPKKTSKWL